MGCRVVWGSDHSLRPFLLHMDPSTCLVFTVPLCSFPAGSCCLGSCPPSSCWAQGALASPLVSPPVTSRFLPTLSQCRPSTTRGQQRVPKGARLPSPGGGEADGTHWVAGQLWGRGRDVVQLSPCWGKIQGLSGSPWLLVY